MSMVFVWCCYVGVVVCVSLSPFRRWGNTPGELAKIDCRIWLSRWSQSPRSPLQAPCLSQVMNAFANSPHMFGAVKQTPVFHARFVRKSTSQVLRVIHKVAQPTPPPLLLSPLLITCQSLAGDQRLREDRGHGLGWGVARPRRGWQFQWESIMMVNNDDTTTTTTTTTNNNNNNNDNVNNDNNSNDDAYIYIYICMCVYIYIYTYDGCQQNPVLHFCIAFISIVLKGCCFSLCSARISQESRKRSRKQNLV